MSHRTPLVRGLPILVAVLVITLVSHRASAQAEQRRGPSSDAPSEQRVIAPMSQTPAGERYALQGVGFVLTTAAAGLVVVGVTSYVADTCHSDEFLGCLGPVFGAGALATLVVLPFPALTAYAIGNVTGGTGRYQYTLLGSVFGFAGGLGILAGSLAIDNGFEDSTAFGVATITLATAFAATCSILAYEWSSDDPPPTTTRLRIGASPTANLRGLSAQLTGEF